MAYTVIGDEKFLVSATIGGGGSASFDDLSANPLTPVQVARNSTIKASVVADTSSGGTHALYYDNAPVPYASMKKQYTNYDDSASGKCNFVNNTFTLTGWFKAIPYNKFGAPNYYQTRFGYGGNASAGSTNIVPVAMYWNDRDDGGGSDNLSFKSDGPSNNWMPIRQTGLDDGDWHHWLFWYNGSQKRVYIDGSLVGTATSTGNSTSVPSYERQMRIGFYPAQGFSSTAPYFNGYADDLRYFNRALTTTEIASLASGRTSAPPSGIYDPFRTPRLNSGTERLIR